MTIRSDGGVSGRVSALRSDDVEEKRQTALGCNELAGIVARLEDEGEEVLGELGDR